MSNNWHKNEKFLQFFSTTVQFILCNIRNLFVFHFFNLKGIALTNFLSLYYSKVYLFYSIVVLLPGELKCSTVLVQ